MTERSLYYCLSCDMAYREPDGCPHAFKALVSSRYHTRPTMTAEQIADYAAALAAQEAERATLKQLG